MKVKKRKIGWRLLVWGMLLGAVATEYSKPPGERTGTGAVAGVVPYDFRAPTLQRFRDAMWSPEDARLVKSHPFGVGWTLNFGRLWRMWNEAQEEKTSTP